MPLFHTNALTAVTPATSVFCISVYFILYIYHLWCCNDVNPSFVTPNKIFPGSSSGSAEQIYLPPKARWCRKKPLYGLLKKNRRALWITHLWRRTGGKGRLKSVPASRPLTSRLERPSHSDIEVSQDIANAFFFLGGRNFFCQQAEEEEENEEKTIS